MPVWNEAFPPLSREELQENSCSQRECSGSLYTQALQSEVVRLREENDSLKRCLALVRENASLRTANLIANVIGWSDDQLDNQLSRLFLSIADSSNRNVGDTRSASNQFRPISPAAFHVPNINIQEPSNTSAKFSEMVSPRPKTVSPSSLSYPPRPDGPRESAVMSGRYTIPRDSISASSDRQNFGHINKLSSIRYPDSSDAEEIFEQMLHVEPVNTKSSAASGYKMPTPSQTVGRSDRRSAGSRKMYGNRTISEGYGSDVGGAKGDIDGLPGTSRNNQSLVSMESENRVHGEHKHHGGAATDQSTPARNTTATDTYVNSKSVQAILDPMYGSRQDESSVTSEVRKRIGEPVASSTPAKQNHAPDKSPDRNREIDQSQKEMRPGEWQKLGDLSSTDSSVINRPIDQVIGIKPVVTDEHRFKLAKIKPSKRLVGEIAFQLDRRILEYVFAFKDLANIEGRPKRYYGFSIANLGQMIRKEATDERGKFNPKKELEMRYRFDYIKKTLSSFGYVLEKHGQFSQDLVNKYGLFNGPPDKLTIKNFGLEDPVILRLLLSHLLGDRVELENVLILLDCLCLLAHDDRKSIFLW